MSETNEEGFIVTGYAKSLLRTPLPKASPTARKATSAPPLKHKLTSGSSSRLYRDYRAALRQGSPSPSPSNLESKRARTLSESPLAKKSASTPHTNGLAGRNSNMASAISSYETSNSTSSDESNDSLLSNKRVRSSAKLTKKSLIRKSKVPTAWSAAEDLVLWRFLLKQGDGKFNWKEVSKNLNCISVNRRTVSGIQQHWPKLRDKLEKVITQNMNQKDIDHVGKLIELHGRSNSRSTTIEEFKKSSISRNRSSSSNLFKDELYDSMDQDS